MYTIDFFAKAGELPVDSWTIEAENISQAVAEARTLVASHGAMHPHGGYVITDSLNVIVHNSFEDGAEAHHA